VVAAASSRLVPLATLNGPTSAPAMKQKTDHSSDRNPEQVRQEIGHLPRAANEGLDNLDETSIECCRKGDTRKCTWIERRRRQYQRHKSQDMVRLVASRNNTRGIQGNKGQQGNADRQADGQPYRDRSTSVGTERGYLKNGHLNNQFSGPSCVH